MIPSYPKKLHNCEEQWMIRKKLQVLQIYDETMNFIT